MVFERIGLWQGAAIEHDGNRIWESAVINEYLDEVFPSPPLLPDGPARRAVARLWIDWANTRFVTAFGALLRGSTEALRDAARSELRTALEFLDREGFAKASADGPYFFGPAPSLVDFTLYPWFERWPALEQLRGSVLARPIDRLKRYSEQIAKLPAVKIEQNPTTTTSNDMRFTSGPTMPQGRPEPTDLSEDDAAVSPRAAPRLGGEAESKRGGVPPTS